MYAAQNACPHAGYGLDVGDIEDYAGCGRAGFDDALRAPAVSCPAHLFAFEVPRRWWSDGADDTVQEAPEAVVHYVYNISAPTTLGRGSGDAADTAADKLCL